MADAPAPETTDEIPEPAGCALHPVLAHVAPSAPGSGSGQQTTLDRASWEAGRDAAAASIDCACARSAAVRAAYEEGGYRRARAMCEAGSACCAIAAAEIRDLKMPEPAT